MTTEDELTLVPKSFRVNRETMTPFTGEGLASLPRQQQILERALGTTKYVARSLRALAKEAGLTPDQVRAYCEDSAHIARSPLENFEDEEHYGHIVRLKEKYHISPSGRLVEEMYLPAGAPLYDVFISYTHRDTHLAQEIREELLETGLKCFMAEKDVKPASDWSEEIRFALQASDLVLLLITTRSLDRPWILLETGAAWVLGKKILPVLNQVDPETLVEPLKNRQARFVETTAQRKTLARELTNL